VKKLASQQRRKTRRIALAIHASLLFGCLVSASYAAGTSGTYHLAQLSHVPTAITSGQAARVASLATSTHLQLSLNLPLRNETELDQLLLQIYDPQSPNYHHYLSVQEFTNRFGPTQQDVDRVVAWATANGLKVTGTPANRRLVAVDGSVENINRALHLTIGSYQHPTESRTFFAPDREPTIDLAVPLLQITGLNNFALPHTHLRHGDALLAVRSTGRLSGSGPSGQFLPSDMRAAYYGSSGTLTGAGQTVGIFSFEGYKSSDVQLFYTKTGMTSNVPISNVLVNGFSGSCGSGCDDGEQVLDIVNVIGMAPGLSKVLFYEGSSATNVLNQMAADNTAKILSCSWYDGDFGHAQDPIYKEFQAQGQTFVNASGDDGAYNKQTFGYPSLTPNVLQVGGTDLTTNGAGGSWSSETAWSYSGGGNYSSANYTIPSYQSQAGVITSTNKGSTTLRNDPDVAMEANFDNPTVSNGQFETGYGGTSFAAPRWAGFLALANQQLAAAGKGPLGDIHTTLYSLGLGSNYHNLFHDITSGSNPPTSGSGSGFKAVSGYDLVTGWGSANGQALINALTQ